MEELYELLGQIEEMSKELQSASLLRKGIIGYRLAKKSMELTKKSFKVMSDFQKRLIKLENKVL